MDPSTKVSRNACALHINTSSLGDATAEEMMFTATSDRDPSIILPLPAEIFRHQKDNGKGVIILGDRNLVIKYGPSSEVRVEEAQAMRAVKQVFFDNEIPVPEVYGWRRRENRVFIYMSFIKGLQLRQAWPSLTVAEKKTICEQLREIIVSLRKLTQRPGRKFIGSVSEGPVQDRFFSFGYEKGPFQTIESFNDWFLTTALRITPGPDGKFPGMYEDGLYRDLLSDSGNVYFTHGDLNLGNIIIGGEFSYRQIVGIVDWEQAGWYPEYWEYCRMLYAVQEDHGWRSEGWADQIMQSYENEWHAFTAYFLWTCP